MASARGRRTISRKSCAAARHSRSIGGAGSRIPWREAKARALSLLSGAAAMARAVKDDRIRQEILAAANTAAKAI